MRPLAPRRSGALEPPGAAGRGTRCRPCSSASPSRSAWRSLRRVSCSSRRNHCTATTTARTRVGASPNPQAISPARCWSASGSGPHGRLICPKKSGASRVSLPVSATPKNAWNEIVAKRMTSSISGDQRGGPGSMPMSTQTNRYPVSRKWAIISRCPVWVVSDSSNSAGPVERREAEEEQARRHDRVGEHPHRPRVHHLQQHLARPPGLVGPRLAAHAARASAAPRARAAAARSSRRPCASPCAR